MPAPPVYHYTQYIIYNVPTHTAAALQDIYDLPVSVRGANRVLVRDCCEQDVKNDIVDLPIMDELLYRCHYYRRYSCRLRTHNSYMRCATVRAGFSAEVLGRYIYCGGHFRAHKSFLMGDQSAHYIYIFTCTRLTWKRIKRYTQLYRTPPHGCDGPLIGLYTIYDFIAVVGLVYC